MQLRSIADEGKLLEGTLRCQPESETPRGPPLDPQAWYELAIDAS